MKSKLLIIVLLSHSVVLWSNTPRQNILDLGNYMFFDAVRLWKNTNNAAGLSLDSLVHLGQSAINFGHRGGNFYKVQEGTRQNQFSFVSDQYQPVGKKLYGYGKFEFETGRIQERAWSDVFRSYNTNPYFTGSAIPGRYDYQNILLTASLATLPMGNFRYGMKVNYLLGDLSRLRDPRTRSNLLEYQLIPSVVYSLGENSPHHIGLNGYYKRRKEKIPNITTVQTDPSMQYYFMSGMENALGVASGFNGYNREWVDHRFGAELAYSYRIPHYYMLTTIGLEWGEESVYGTYKYEPGKYYGYRYHLHSQHRIFSSGNKIHQLDFQAQMQQDYADEYRQELTVSADPLTGYNSYHYHTILTLKKRYQVQTFETSAHYRLNITDQTSSRIDSYLGMKTTFVWMQNKYLLHTSYRKHNFMNVMLEAGKFLLNNRLKIDGHGLYHRALSTSQHLADNTTDYATQVLIPDLDYYGAHYWNGRMNISLQLPVTWKKHSSMIYITTFADYLRASTRQHSHRVGISLGLLH